MILTGHIINKGKAEGYAIVINTPFSFIGDFEPTTGKLLMSEKMGKNVKGKVLVCPTGKGGTLGPYVAYDAMIRGTAPAAILCEKADPILALSAITIDIPMIDNFDKNLLKECCTDDYIKVNGDEGIVEIIKK
ncbi:MAG: aconitase X swivel domain-containing protein [Promethearchaeota archaeon]